MGETEAQTVSNDDFQHPLLLSVDAALLHNKMGQSNAQILKNGNILCTIPVFRVPSLNGSAYCSSGETEVG